MKTTSSAKRRTQLTPSGQGALRNLSVLVVDDSVITREIAAAHIRAEGHDVDCVAGGARALAAARDKKYDLLIMDIQMPDMDGLEAARLIRALPGGRGDVRVVSFTVQNSPEQSAACQQAGMVGHLAKPFTKAALMVVLNDALKAAPQFARYGVLSEDAALPVIDADMFAANTALLPPVQVIAYLENLAASMRAVLDMLHSGNSHMAPDLDFIANVQKLAGNVSMYGFMRLANAARRFARAAGGRAATLALLSERLSLALNISLEEAELRLAALHDCTIDMAATTATGAEVTANAQIATSSHAISMENARQTRGAARRRLPNI